MNKKKVLFIISNMESGGVSKSMSSLLNVIDTNRYDVSVFITNPTGVFMELTTLISIAVAAVLAWPQDIARQRIVLLPSIDGAQSAVLLQTPHGERLLDRPFASLDVMDKGGLKESVLTEAEVSDRYGLLLAAQPPRPKSFLLYFESGSDNQLTPESSQVLIGLKAFLQSRPAPEVTVIGHTDSSGSVAAKPR